MYFYITLYCEQFAVHIIDAVNDMVVIYHLRLTMTKIITMQRNLLYLQVIILPVSVSHLLSLSSTSLQSCFYIIFNHKLQNPKYQNE